MRGTQNKLSEGSIVAGLASPPGRATPRELGGCTSIRSQAFPRGTEPPNGGDERGRGTPSGPRGERGNSRRKISNANPCPLSFVGGKGAEGSGMIRFWWQFSPQNPVGTLPCRWATRGVVANIRAARRILAKDIKTGICLLSGNQTSSPGLSASSLAPYKSDF